MSLRQWQINTTHLSSLVVAADARLSQTDYLDDQVWVFSPGSGESPALTLQTRYGGRAGLASLVPMWTIDGRTLYQAATYAHPPLITAFAPGYLQAKAKLTATLPLQADYWAMTSHSLAGRIVLANTGSTVQTLRFDLFAHLGMDNAEVPLRVIDLPPFHVLHFGRVADIEPVIMIEKGRGSKESASKIGIDLTIPPGKKVSVRFVHAAAPDLSRSVKLAASTLKANWQPRMQQITQVAQRTPDIQTGDADLDLAIALSYRELMGAFLRPTASLPYPSFVAVRQPDRGWSRNRDGRDHTRAWSGQPMPLAYLTALAAAPVEAVLAQGIVRNFLAVQQSDGWIDWKPGLAGQRYGVMGLPLLARLSWSIFQYTEDSDFLREVFPAVKRAYHRWFMPDLDKDGDGLPEWRSEAQTGYVSTPTFSIGLPWGQHLDIRTVEAPDLLAYLLSEAISLKAIAYFLHDDDAVASMSEQIARLQTALDSLWRDRHFAYRDRDSHQTTTRVTILEDSPGDTEHFPAATLTPPSRIIIEVIGGTGRPPRMTLHLSGTDAGGAPLVEAADADRFVWSSGRGVYTSEGVFAQIDRIYGEGLIRVYRLRAYTPDLTRLDIGALLPLWSTGLSAERSADLIALMTDPAHFWRPSGIGMCSAQDAEFDPANASGSGGVWAYWATLLGEGLIEAGRLDLAADLLKRLMTAQAAVLKANGGFSEFYHSDQPQGLGESGHLMGIIPLHLLLRVLGVRIISAQKVWVGGSFVWGRPVTIQQHGVRVERSSTETIVHFPSGQIKRLQPDADWQEVIDTQQPG